MDCVGVRLPFEGDDALRLTASTRDRLESLTSSEPGLRGRFKFAGGIGGEAWLLVDEIESLW